jgi:serine/threonine protein phosphatase 1
MDQGASFKICRSKAVIRRNSTRVAIADQSEDDLLWIREPFLSSKAGYTTFVVHGHTPTESGLPDLRSHRLDLDTGACFGRELTAAAFTNQRARPMFFANSRGAVWQS